MGELSQLFLNRDDADNEEDEEEDVETDVEVELNVEFEVEVVQNDLFNDSAEEKVDPTIRIIGEKSEVRTHSRRRFFNSSELIKGFIFITGRIEAVLL